MTRMDKVLAFDLSADMAFFRRGYTTTSPLTYSFPPKTVISGFLAAVLGKKNSRYRGVFNRSSVAIVISSPLRKQFIVQNLLYLKGSDDYNRTERRLQAPFHYIMHPRYRVYFYLEGYYYEQLKQMLENGESVYTPYLGVANCIADITYHGEYEVSEREVSNGSAEIASVIPLDTVPIGSIDFSAGESGLRLIREKIPVSMDESRVVLKYSDIIFAEPVAVPEGKEPKVAHSSIGSSPDNGGFYQSRLKLTSGKYWEVRSKSGAVENVIFF